MIYSPEVCKQAGLMNAYYELPVSALGDVGLKSGQIETLKLKAKNGTVVFMVYNSNFRRNYTNFGYLRWYHVSHLLIIAAGIVFANFWLYDQLGISSII